MAVLAAGWLCGCDDADTQSVLTVEPGSSDLEGRTSVLLTVQLPEGDPALPGPPQAAFLPLRWSVNNPNLGVIASSKGYQAVYVSHGREGQNVVFVVDQSGREGVAAINQY